MTMAVRGLLLYCVFVVIFSFGEAATATKYRAAVVEHQRQSGPDALTSIWKNLKVYADRASLAAQQGADVIVFPEYGLTGWDFTTRDEISPYLQVAPDPQKERWNPCAEELGQAVNDNATKIVRALSCIAANNSIVVVANLGTRVDCDPTADPSCPRDGRFQFNTNVAFNKSGELIGRYHKYNLFNEPFMDPAPQPEYAIFDAGFARFGMFICFDIAFYEPAVHLVKKLGINNIIFPTAWVDELPFNTAIQIQSAWAHGLGVNLLAANYFLPSEGAIGSGIYSSVDGALNYTYNESTPGRLLMADVPIQPPPSPVQEGCHHKYHPSKQTKAIYKGEAAGVPWSAGHLFFYESLSNFTHSFLGAQWGHQTACHGRLCCRLKYYFTKHPPTDTYALVAFSGNVGHIGGYAWQEQVCAVVYCTSANISTCGRQVEVTPTSRFRHLDISGNFATEFLYPHMFTTDLRLISTSQWQFVNQQHCNNNRTHRQTNRGSLKARRPIRDPIYSAAIYGRQYSNK